MLAVSEHIQGSFGSQILHVAGQRADPGEHAVRVQT